MKNIIIFFALCLFGLNAMAQMQVDKKIEMTGATPSDKKIEGIEEVVNSHDAANKEYVDTAIANRTGSSGGSLPAGSCVMTMSETPPAGYFYSGSKIVGGDSWEAKSDFTYARYHPASAAINGKMYLFGGYGGSFSNRIDEYDPVTDTWTYKTGMPSSRFLQGAASIGNKAYIVGGWQQTNICYEYDAVSNTVATKAPMVNARSSLGVFAVNGKIYAIGGSNGGNNTYYNYNEEYDPTTNTWTTKAAIPEPADGFAGGVWNDKIYITLGFNNNTGYQDEVRIYDPSTNTWTTGASQPSSLDLRHMASAVVNGKLYMLGGLDPNHQDGIHVYDIDNNKWEVGYFTTMTSPRSRLTGVNVNGRIYVAGGSSSSAQYLSTTEEFTPPTDFYIHCLQ